MQTELEKLKHRLVKLERRHFENFTEIKGLKNEIELIQERINQSELSSEKEHSIESIELSTEQETDYEPVVSAEEITIKEGAIPEFQPKAAQDNVKRSKPKRDLEKFIGENIINKIGIIITVLGVSIGAKYAIDKDLISPATRIALAYMIGGGLVFFAMKLKEKYKNFSAVLLSGAMVIKYFTSYAAYSFYDMFSLYVAFLLMLLFTVFTVLSALKYNRQIIAVIGLIGAYIIPFLLSTGSGKIEIMFAYMSILNLGILFISIKRSWNAVYYLAYSITWLVFISWFILSYRQSYFSISSVFSTIFYLIFHLSLLSPGYKGDREIKVKDIFLILLNSILYFSFGYYSIKDHSLYDNLIGFFTVFNGLVNGIIAYIIYKKSGQATKAFQLCLVLLITFITITIPVQLDGSWVTLIWISEGAALMFIAKKFANKTFQTFSWIMILIATVSLFHDWQHLDSIRRYREVSLGAFSNTYFLVSLFYTAATYGIYKWSKDLRSESSFNQWILPAVLIFAFYVPVFNEVRWLFEGIILDAKKELYQNNYYWLRDIKYLKIITISLYNMFFIAGMYLYNHAKLRVKNLYLFTGIVGLIIMFVSLISGLYALSEIRENYLNEANQMPLSFMTVNIRYLFISVMAFLFYTIKRSFLYYSISPQFKTVLTAFMHVSIAWVLSSELLHIMDFMNVANQYKLALSILWGMYAISLLFTGIKRGEKVLRIIAISAFGLTLLKLFFYDISHLNTISKTIVMIVLGVLMLIASFLYNKFKDQINENN